MRHLTQTPTLDSIINTPFRKTGKSKVFIVLSLVSSLLLKVGHITALRGPYREIQVFWCLIFWVRSQHSLFILVSEVRVQLDSWTISVLSPMSRIHSDDNFYGKHFLWHTTTFSWKEKEKICCKSIIKTGYLVMFEKQDPNSTSKLSSVGFFSSKVLLLIQTHTVCVCLWP